MRASKKIAFSRGPAWRENFDPHSLSGKIRSDMPESFGDKAAGPSRVSAGDFESAQDGREKFDPSQASGGLKSVLAASLFAGLLALVFLPPAAAADVFALEEEVVNLKIPPPEEFFARVLPPAIAVLLNPAKSDTERLAAARLLDWAGPAAKPHLPKLILNLPDLAPEPRWRISRIFVVGINEDGALAEAFLRLAQEDADPDLRLYAVRILSASAQPGEQVRSMLLDVAINDGNSAVRRAALRGLEENFAGADEAIDVFVAFLSAADRDFRHIAARGLERAGTTAERAIPHLLASFTSEDVYPHIRAQMWRALLAVGPDDERVIGPHARRGVRVGPDETAPGLRRRLAESFQREAESTRISLADDGWGYRHFSGRGWRGDERPLPAFPGAQGFGMWTPGGRGGKIIRVTTLEDAGPDSFREAVEASGPRIVIFDVSGTIHLQRPLHIKNSYITIAGQTAPGDGIAIAGDHTQIDANDVIVRHLRFRPGDASPHGAKAINVRGSDNVILDHLSTSWAKEETFSVVHSGRVTVQRSLITHGLVDAGHPEGLRGHGSLVRGAGPYNYDFAQGSNYSFINNLWAHQRSRAPRPGNERNIESDPVGPIFDFRNNVFYNWGGTTSGDNFDRDSISRYNFVGNYFKPGPDSRPGSALHDQSAHSRGHWSGNIFNGEMPDDQWSLVTGLTNPNYRQEEPFHAGWVLTEAATAAFERVLAYSGAWPRDSYDRRVLEEVRAGAGALIDSEAEVGGLPELRPALAATDSIGNGIPDWWRIKFGFAPTFLLDPSGDLNGTGYTNIEEYLNGMDMEVFVDHTPPTPRL